MIPTRVAELPASSKVPHFLFTPAHRVGRGLPTLYPIPYSQAAYVYRLSAFQGLDYPFSMAMQHPAQQGLPPYVDNDKENLVK